MCTYKTTHTHIQSYPSHFFFLSLSLSFSKYSFMYTYIIIHNHTYSYILIQNRRYTYIIILQLYHINIWYIRIRIRYTYTICTQLSSPSGDQVPIATERALGEASVAAAIPRTVFMAPRLRREGSDSELSELGFVWNFLFGCQAPLF